jgi:hypothetical protein
VGLNLDLCFGFGIKLVAFGIWCCRAQRGDGKMTCRW